MDETFRFLPSDEISKLKSYVSEMDDCRYDHQAEGDLRLDMTHSNLAQRYHDILFHEQMTVQQVKEKVFRHCGTSVGCMELFLRRGGGGTILLDDDSRQLRYYGAGNGMELYIKDNDPHSLSRAGGLEDVSQIEKYTMSDADYDKRSNTVRSWKKAEQEKRKAEAEARGEAAEGESLEPAEPAEDPEEVAARFQIGSRCEVDPGARRGEVAHVGPIEGLKGLWVGVRLDEPQGLNDGSKGGTRYFECPGPKYGCFSKTEYVRVGDYPERDPFASDDDEF